MSTRYHLCLNCRGFIQNQPYPRGYRGVFLEDDGSPMEPAKARDHLFDELSKGHKVIPCSPCDNFDWEHGCQGHPEPEDAPAKGE